MMKLAKRTSVAVALIAAALSCQAIAQQAPSEPASASLVTGVTAPSVHAKLGLNQLGIVKTLPVKEGQQIKKGDLILQQDDGQEQAALEALELEANSDVKIQASKADLKVKQLQFQRYKELQAKGSSNPSEVEEAEVKVVYADAQVKVAELEQQKAKLEAKRQRIKVEQMRILSPVDGFVETIDTSVGEITDPQKPVLSVVQNDPVWIEFYLPVGQAQKLKVGQTVEVKYIEDAQFQPAKMIYRAPVANAQADMQKIRLEMANTANKDTGLQVSVKLPAELGPAVPSPAAAAASATMPPTAPPVAPPVIPPAAPEVAAKP